MGNEGKDEQRYDECSGPQLHRDHLCHLMDRGMLEEVRRRSSNPAFYCGNCGARANTRDDVCNPEPLPGKR